MLIGMPIFLFFFFGQSNSYISAKTTIQETPQTWSNGEKVKHTSWVIEEVQELINIRQK